MTVKLTKMLSPVGVGRGVEVDFGVDAGAFFTTGGGVAGRTGMGVAATSGMVGGSSV